MDMASASTPRIQVFVQAQFPQCYSEERSSGQRQKIRKIWMSTRPIPLINDAQYAKMLSLFMASSLTISPPGAGPWCGSESESSCAGSESVCHVPYDDQVGFAGLAVFRCLTINIRFRERRRSSFRLCLPLCLSPFYSTTTHLRHCNQFERQVNIWIIVKWHETSSSIPNRTLTMQLSSFCPRLLLQSCSMYTESDSPSQWSTWYLCNCMRKC